MNSPLPGSSCLLAHWRLRQLLLTFCPCRVAAATPDFLKGLVLSGFNHLVPCAYTGGLPGLPSTGQRCDCRAEGGNRRRGWTWGTRSVSCGGSLKDQELRKGKWVRVQSIAVVGQ